jgi:CRP/FNR family transcriptional regulator, cyclic AMP receptor protein
MIDLSLPDLLDRGRHRRYPAGAMLMAEGDPGGVVLVIVSGQAAVVVGDTCRSGGKVVATRGPGDLLGELSVLDGLPRSATVIAATDVEVAAMSATTLIDAIQALEPAAAAALRAAARSVRAATDADAISVGGAPASTVAGWLLERHTDSAADDALVEYTAGELAEELAISQESLSRALGHLTAIGALLFGHGRVVILDADSLEHAAYDTVSQVTAARPSRR